MVPGSIHSRRLRGFSLGTPAPFHLSMLWLIGYSRLPVRECVKMVVCFPATCPLTSDDGNTNTFLLFNFHFIYAHF